MGASDAKKRVLSKTEGGSEKVHVQARFASWVVMMCADLAAAMRPSPFFDEVVRAATSAPDFGVKAERTNGVNGALIGWAKWLETAGASESDSLNWIAFDEFRGEIAEKPKS